MTVTGVTLHGHLIICDRTCTLFFPVYVIFFLKSLSSSCLSFPPGGGWTCARQGRLDRHPQQG